MKNAEKPSNAPRALTHGLLRRGFLRETLAGEYLALALMLHAGVGGLVWGASAASEPTAFVVVAACCWIGGRAAGAFGRRPYATLVTAALLVGLLMLRHVGVASLPSEMVVFSLSGYILALLGVLFLDVV